MLMSPDLFLIVGGPPPKKGNLLAKRKAPGPKTTEAMNNIRQGINQRRAIRPKVQVH